MKYCEFCSKTSNDFSDQSGFLKHKKSHGDKVSCSHCGKLLKNKRVLEYHIKSLHGNKTFFCKHCKEEFQDKANLKEHLKSHKKYVLNKKSHLRNVMFVAKLQRTFQTSLGSISI